MKKIYMSLFLISISTATFPYKITNSQASSIPIRVKLIKPFQLADKIVLDRDLAPGESFSGNLDEILKKTKAKTLKLSSSSKHRVNFVSTTMSPNMNLEILVQGYENFFGSPFKPTMAGGAFDHSTGEVYNRIGLQKAIQMLKKNTPLRLPIISTILQRANISVLIK